MTTHRMSIFDVDGTLCSLGRKLGEPLAPEVAEGLRSLENRGNRIVLATGRPAQFALGIALGAGLNDPIIIGDNGCVMSDMKAEKEIHIAERPAEMERLMDEIASKYGESIYFAPNQVSCSIFPKEGMKLKGEIRRHIRKFVKSSGGSLKIFEHESAIDVTPGGVDKGVATRMLMSLFGMERAGVSAVGNGTNDIPMFSEAGFCLIIGYDIEYPGAHHCDNICEALRILEFSSSRPDVSWSYPLAEAWIGQRKSIRRRIAIRRGIVA